MSLAGRGLNRAAALERYVAAMEGLRPDNLDTLEDVFASDARFVDPFNDVRGIRAIRAVFAHGFAKWPRMRFVVCARAVDGERGLLRWRMSSGENETAWFIDGMSEVTFAVDGRIAAHLDYWDPAGQLYERVPLLGWLMRRIKRRLAAPSPRGD